MGANIAVVGAGAIGAAIGGYLIEKGQKVTLIDQWSDHVEAMKKNGLEIVARDRSFTVPVEAYHLSQVSSLREKFDIVFLSVKSYDTRWSTYLIEPMLKQTGFILPAQNALNDELVAQIVGYNRTVGCVPMISTGIYEPGRLVRTSPPNGKSFTVGELNGQITTRVKDVVEMLQAVGPSEATANIWGFRWTKLQINCMGNSVAGLIGPELQFLDNEQKELAMLIRVSIAAEVARVGASLGIAFEPLSKDIKPDDLAAATTRKAIEALKHTMLTTGEQREPSKEEAERLGAPARPSLLQDVMKGRRTEVDQLNGFIAAKGKQLAVDTPINDAVVDLFKQMNTGEIKPSPSNLNKLELFLPK
jgi:2-dehydropantoate 2-reductase